MKKPPTSVFLITIVTLFVFGMTMAVVFYEPKSRPEFTVRGLDTNRPDFKPQVVILSGTNSNGYFQIRMRGADYYYFRKWNKQKWENGSWFTVELDISPDVAFGYGLHCNGFGSGGGGGFSAGLPEDLVLARRLWNGTNFIGANTNELIAEERRWDRKEEFQKLEKVGPYLIPKQIEFSNFNSSDCDRKVETYTILQVEFSDQPSTNWFWDVKRKYFDHSLTTDLDEPGPFLGERKIFGIFPAP